MEIDIAVLADAANVTMEGKINIAGAFRSVFSPTTPASIPFFHIVFSLTLNNRELGVTHNFTINFKNLNGDLLTEIGNGEFTLPRIGEYNYPMLNLIIGISTLQIAEYGHYFFELVIGGKVIKEIPFELTSPPNNQKHLLNPA
jgi:hypothetical protein